MLFNSYEFILIFLPITFFIYFYLLNKRLVLPAKGFLVFSSLFFYSYWNIVYLPIILSSMLFNFLVGGILNSEKRIIINKKILLILSIIINLLLLGYFKYFDFFISNVNYFNAENIELLNLVLPLAISFFTFQQIAYLVDSYKKDIKEYDFINYSLFVTFFPQLIAGPIVHHKEMMPQFSSKWNLVKKNKNIIAGIFIFSMGLFKKVIIADTFAKWVKIGFDDSASLTLIEGWITSLSYTFQLYFDFSAYTDMAIGIALLFNIKLPANFNSPYKANNIKEFLRIADVVVLPSYREGLSRVLIESAAASKPIITANVPGCKDIVINNKNGYLVNIKDELDLYNKMLLISNNKTIRKNMGLLSRKIAESEFDVILFYEHLQVKKC